MKILFVSDAWSPQVNGVVRTLQATIHHLIKKGHQVETFTPLGRRSIPCPTYNEISLSLLRSKEINSKFEEFNPDMIHIATEGPIGWSVRNFCKKYKIKFTSSFHTLFPDYVYARTRIPLLLTYKLLRRFHSQSQQIMVSTQSIENKLNSYGFKKMVKWSRGVDTEMFYPRERSLFTSKPKLLYVGRVSIEKNLEAFLSMDIDSNKIVVGDGPQLNELKQKYPEVYFAGSKFSDELARYYSMADAFVFPSRTDTFGLVMLEALACGTPVAAYPVEGPIDVIKSSEVGCLDKNLKTATLLALRKSRRKCQEYAKEFSWEKCTNQFFQNLQNT